MQGDSLFSTSFLGFIICRFFNDGHSDWCEVIPHCSLTYLSLIVILNNVSCAYWPSVCLLQRNVYMGLLCIFPLIIQSPNISNTIFQALSIILDGLLLTQCVQLVAQSILKFIWKCEGLTIAQTILREKRKSQRSQIF